MKFPDLTKSHMDSPGFKRDLKQLERDTDTLNTSCQSIISILAEKASLARRDTYLTKLLIRDIQSVGMSHIVEFEEEESGVKSDTKLSHVCNGNTVGNSIYRGSRLTGRRIGGIFG